MDYNAFLKSRHPDWDRLEALLEAADARGLANLSRDEIQELSRLYRAACSDLVRASSEMPNPDLVRFLNSLVARGHGRMYSARPVHARHAVEFLAGAFPREVRASSRYVLLAFAIFLAPALVAYVGTLLDPAAIVHFSAPEVVVQKQRLLEEKSAVADVKLEDSPIAASEIMRNNIQISILAFATGILFGVGTFLLLVGNGLMFGSLAAFYENWGGSFIFWSEILPHGVIELTSIFIAGGSGLLLARALIAPGDLSRRDALALYGRRAIRLMAGVAFLLVIAGTIEGFLSFIQGPEILEGLSTHGWRTFKFVFGCMTAPALFGYLGLAGRGMPQPEESREHGKKP